MATANDVPKHRRMRESKKAARAAADAESKVLYLNLPLDVAALLEAEAIAEDRPMSVQAARIIRAHFEKR